MGARPGDTTPRTRSRTQKREKGTHRERERATEKSKGRGSGERERGGEGGRVGEGIQKQKGVCALCLDEKGTGKKSWERVFVEKQIYPKFVQILGVRQFYTLKFGCAYFFGTNVLILSF